ncbi:GntR family transcriptional regulator [Caballeronia sp. LZ043]|uniref:GntR family transcriptional regulator n=1 Tax=Caballeronia sp. LZ043 TaxID=3038569 RepID=UPI0028646508|nr:GntR family transcriptional regulator [Caballeronia sp. LZ043]MDR5823583.1 GntR family transcriptional regulator [Caballeronia sp. LZ043]
MSEFAALTRVPSLAEQAVEKLTKAIVAGHFQPGQRLIETELSLTLGISRAMLREALRTLASEGLVETRNNRGCYVIEPSREDMAQVVMQRAILEGAAARIVAFRRDPDALAKLSRIYQGMQLATVSSDTFRFRNELWNFHRSLMAATGNRFMQQSWSNISNMLQLYIVQAPSETSDPNFILKHMQCFLQCLHEGSPEEAEQLFRSQIIWIAYEMLGAPIEDELQGYLTIVADDRGRIRRLGEAEVKARLRSTVERK